MIMREALSKKFRIFFDRFLGVFTQRLPIKIVCVLLASVIFFYVRYEQEDSREYIANISIRNKPSDLVIANGNIEHVNITIKGFKDQLSNLPAEFNAYVDLTNSLIGSNIYPVRLEEMIEKNNKIRVSISPRIIPVVLDEISYKSVPIVAASFGIPALGVTVENIIVNPSNTIISGPRKIVSSITELKTLGIDLTDKFEDYDITQNVRMPNFINADILQVNASVIFNKNIVMKEYSNLIVDINKLDSRLEVKSGGGFFIESIVLEASDFIMSNVTKKDIVLSLNLEDVSRAGIYSNMEVDVELPHQVKMISIEPSSFTLDVVESD